MSDRPNPGSGGEVALIALGGGVIAAGFGTWLGARLATLVAGGEVRGGLDVWLPVTGRLLQGKSPAAAWGSNATDLPSPTIYWIAAAVAYLAVIAVAVGLVIAWRRLSGKHTKRVRFGQPTEAHEAAPADVAPLRVDDTHPPTGRMLLGRMADHRRVLLATEDRTRHPLKGRAARRQGNRGSVALIGPTGSGKTALASSAIATWRGPVVAVSVKRDLFDSTAAARQRVGEIAVFDPGASTNLATARWSPFRHIETSSGALRTGRALAQAIPKSGVTNAEYWAKHGEKLMGAFLCVAGLSRLMVDEKGKPYKPISMEQLASWVTAMTTATDPRMNELIRRGLGEGQPVEVQLMARHAANTFTGVQKEEHKIRSSVYATAVLALDPWLEPAVAHSASDSAREFYASEEHYGFKPRFVDLEWLMSGDEGRGNTLYLTASQPEFERLSPVLGGLLADIKDTIHQWDIAGRRLDKPLLFVIDEAGQLELGWLPTEVSTIAALGAFFVTCWQSLSQMQHRYETLADTVLSGHRTKCFFAGIDDLTTIRYLGGLLGHEHVERWTASHDVPSLLGGGNSSAGRRSLAETTSREEFVAPNTVREMYPGEVILLHGTLPPIHLDAVRWWQEKSLRELVTVDDKGSPTAPDGIRTCPLSTEPAGDPLPVVDPESLRLALEQLPKPDKPRTPKSEKANSSEDAEGDKFSREPEPAPKRPDATLKTLQRCESCGAAIPEGQDVRRFQGRREIVVCRADCDATPHRRAAQPVTR